MRERELKQKRKTNITLDYCKQFLLSVRQKEELKKQNDFFLSWKRSSLQNILKLYKFDVLGFTLFCYRDVIYGSGGRAIAADPDPPISGSINVSKCPWAR